MAKSKGKGKSKKSEHVGSGNGNVGRPTDYPGKRRDRPVQIALTDDGLKALDRGMKRTGKNKANYIEKLLREEEDRHDPKWLWR